ncbi:MAG: ABC transporter permease, partial [Acidimicrobiales bacterium]
MQSATPPTSRGTTVGRWVSQHGEIVALAALLGITFVLPGRIPPAGVYVAALVTGAALALQSLGLVLVYRSNRVINFAQIQMGSAAGLLLVELSVRRQFLVWMHAVCTPCLPTPSGPVNPGFGLDPTELTTSERAAFAATGWLVTANYVLSVLVALIVVAVVVFLLYHLVVKRFADAPRLILTVVSIGLAEVFAVITGQLPRVFGADQPLSAAATLPFSWRLTVGRSVFGAPDVLQVLIAVAAVAGLVWFFRRSTTGVALRGVADNPTRAETLGVPVGRVTARAWVIAGLLSASVSMLNAAAIGANPGGAASGLVRSLAAAVFAGFVSLPLAVIGAIVIAVFDGAVLWSFGSGLLTDGFLVIVIVGVLLVLRTRAGRADSEAPSWAAAREVRPIPSELRGLAPVRSALRRGAGALAVVVLAAPWILSPSQNNLAAVAVISGIVTLSLLVLTGWAGQISLGQFGFAAVGAWVSAVLDWPFPFGFLMGCLAGAAVATALGASSLRLRGLHLAVATLAFAVAVPAILLNPRYLARALPRTVERPILLGLDLSEPRTFYYSCLVFLAVAIAAVIGMRRSRTTRALVACRDNEAAAQSFGINLVRARLTAFAIAGFMAAGAGVLMSWAQFGVEAAAFGPDASVRAFLATVIGGMGSVAGPLIGAGWLGLTSVFGSNGLVSSLGT